MKPPQKAQVALVIFNVLLLTWLFYQKNQSRSFDRSSHEVARLGLSEEELIQRIQTATVVVLAEHTVDGEDIKSSFKEILKKEDGINFAHQIGDDFGHISRKVRENYSVPDGAIAFYEGSPARFSSSLPFYNNRLPGAFNISVASLKKLVEQGIVPNP